MAIWTFVAFALVLGVKYYTSQEMRRLERRLKAVQEGFKKKKDELQQAQDREDETKATEAGHEARIRSMNELIQDLNIRLTSSDSLGDDMMREPDGSPAPTF